MRKLEIKIRKRPQIEWLTLYILVLPFAFFVLMDVLHFPSIVKYTIDVAWILLLMVMLFNSKRARFADVHMNGILRVIVVFVLVTIVGFVLEYQSVLYYLWGFRNNIRFFVFFIGCILVFDHKGAESCMRLMDKLFVINLIVTMYQFFVLNKIQDNLGGIFGTERGCNSYTNIFLLVICVWHILRYMNRDEAIKGCFVRCLLSLVIAALAELKIFFIEFVLVIILASAMTKFSIRKIWIILGAVLGLILGIEIITVMFPSLENWFTFESILETASSEKGYTYRNDMNRLTSVAISWNSFLDTWPRRLFGLGLGNCDYASGYDFLTTPFFRQHGLLHYIWFSSAFMILETGLIGLSVYMFFFVRVFTASHSVERNEPQKSIYCQMAKSMSVISLILIFYNSSMRMECAYMVYFVLAMPFMKKTEEDKELSTATLIKEA